MSKYLMLFRNSTASEEAFQQSTPEEMQAEMEKWGQWIGQIAAQGKLISTDALHMGGKTVSQQGTVVTDGPYVESKELVSGYILLEADDEAEAVAFAKSCPALQHGGIVEVRELMGLGEQ
jgi:hypothetical protein